MKKPYKCIKIKYGDFVERVLVFYLVSVNIIASLVCTVDKLKAVKHKRRISEKTLWIWCFSGGSIGMYVTMLIIRHKTLHKRFMLGIPALIIIQIIFCLVLTKLYGGHIISM